MTDQSHRSGPSWTEFLAKYKLAAITSENGTHDVLSLSGGEYTVTTETRIDRGSGSMYFFRQCNCPARKRCRHIDAVEQMEFAEMAAEADSSGDYDGLDLLERTY